MADPTNYKGSLNVFAQKRGWEPPKYVTTRTGDGPDHEPVFECTVSVHGMISRENKGPSKKKAEQKAARSLYRALNSERSMYRSSEKVQIPERDCPIPLENEVKEVVMIDGENLQKLVEQIPYVPSRQIIVYFSKNHHMAEYKEPGYVLKRISPCTRSDGCDIFMAMDIMTINSQFPNVNQIIIMSRDKFASAVADNYMAFWNGVEVVHEATWKG
jgi:hypothetical protein